MDSHFVRKIMIDSRFRKSGTPGDFTFELKRAVTLPSKCAGFITDIEMVHSWYTIDDHNQFFYFFEVYYDFVSNDWDVRYHRISVDLGNYVAADLATELETRINACLLNGQQTLRV